MRWVWLYVLTHVESGGCGCMYSHTLNEVGVTVCTHMLNQVGVAVCTHMLNQVGVVVRMYSHVE